MPPDKGDRPRAGGGSEASPEPATSIPEFSTESTDRQAKEPDEFDWEAASLEALLDQSEPHPLAEYLIDWSTLEGDLTNEDWLIEPFLARGRNHLLYAQPKAGKSLFALEVSAAAATGRRILHRAAGNPIRVVYLDVEMTRSDVAERLGDMGYDFDQDDLSRLYYLSLPAMDPLDTPEGGASLVSFALSVKADLVVVDTVGGAVVGAENDSNTIEDFARFTAMPLIREGVSVLRTDHEGKQTDRGVRGSSAKTAKTDVVWRLIERQGGIELRATHRRVAWVPDRLELTRKTDPLRHDIGLPTWAAGTKEAAERLDALGAPLDISSSKAARLLRENGGGIRKEALLAGLRWRRSEAAK